MSSLWYNKPAGCWEEALPIGNGRLGAMIFGNPLRERFQLNEDSVWFGGFAERENPHSLKKLEEIRKLVKEGSAAEAEKLMVCAISGTPPQQRVYQPLGDLLIDFTGFTEEIEDYRRELCLDSALHRVSFTCGGNPIKRVDFSTSVDQCLVSHISSDAPGKISLTAQLSRGVFYNESGAAGDDTVFIAGQTGSNGVGFCAMMKITAVNGTVCTVGDHIMVNGADSVQLMVTAATTFRVECPKTECLRLLKNASQFSYEQLAERHTKDHEQYYGRVRLELSNVEELDALPTDERLNRLRETGCDNGLIKTYFDLGRYLMLSGSRPGSLPMTLQGIWNQDMVPSWDSKYTININTEMNYWPAETCALGECHFPLFDHVKRMQKRGSVTAKNMYGCRGFVAHHNTDLWADCAPEGDYIPGTYWLMGGAWLSLHMWEHYLFNPDTQYLREVYPVLREAALFFADFATPYNEYLTVCPTLSPENSYIDKNGDKVSVSAGAAMDYQILRDIFNACIEATEILGIDEDMAELFKSVRDKLPPDRIGQNGQLMEWIEDYKEAEPGHRHISHLYALYPSAQISVAKTPELAKAAERTLELRLKNGGGHTGWSLAWIINLYARLRKPQALYGNIIRLLTQSTQPNLLDSHPPFQIDGNFGGTAGVAEALIQSDRERILLLPSLPAEWPSGQLCGVRVRGGAGVDIEWENGALKKAVIYPEQSFSRTVYYNGLEKVFHFEKDVPVTVSF